MKKLVLILSVVFVTMSSFNSTENLSTDNFDETLDVCKIFADQIATETQQNGGNYFQGWFYAYGYCTSVTNPPQL